MLQHGDIHIQNLLCNTNFATAASLLLQISICHYLHKPLTVREVRQWFTFTRLIFLPADMERQTSPMRDFSGQSPPQSDVNETDGKDTGLRSFFSFPFSSDEVYQVGTCCARTFLLSLKLLGKQGLADLFSRDALRGRSEVEKAEIVLQTQLFYFNRVTGQNLTAEDVRSHQDRADPRTFTETAPSSSSYLDRENRPLTFAELKTLIEEGKTDSIPNNKDIPDTLNVSLSHDLTYMVITLSRTHLPVLPLLRCGGNHGKPTINFGM